jgi:hypothetical protein
MTAEGRRKDFKRAFSQMKCITARTFSVEGDILQGSFSAKGAKV